MAVIAIVPPASRKCIFNGISSWISLQHSENFLEQVFPTFSIFLLSRIFAVLIHGSVEESSQKKSKIPRCRLAIYLFKMVRCPIHSSPPISRKFALLVYLSRLNRREKRREAQRFNFTITISTFPSFCIVRTFRVVKKLDGGFGNTLLTRFFERRIRRGATEEFLVSLRC